MNRITVNFRTKKGVILAYVLIIGSALLILSTCIFFAARASITMAAGSRESREAYLNAKSAVEYSKVLAASEKDARGRSFQTSPEALLSVIKTPDETYYAAFDSNQDLFLDRVAKNSSVYKTSPMQITYTLHHTVTTSPGGFVLTEQDIGDPAYFTTDGAIITANCTYNLEMKFSVQGRSPDLPFGGFSPGNKGIPLLYRIEPLKGSYIAGSSVPGSGNPDDPVIPIPMGTAFDDNLSMDLSCYVRQDTLGETYLYPFNYLPGVETPLFSGHSILLSVPITQVKLAPTQISGLDPQRQTLVSAHKIYCSNSTPFQVKNYDPEAILTLETDALYLGGDCTFYLRDNAPLRISLRPQGGKNPTGNLNTALYFPKDTTFTAVFDNQKTLSQTVPKGYYTVGPEDLLSYTGESHALPDVKELFPLAGQLAAKGPLKPLDPAKPDPQSPILLFDKYLIEPSCFSLKSFASGEALAWTNQVENASGIDFILTDMDAYVLGAESSIKSAPLDLAIVFAASIRPHTGPPYLFSAKQIRLVSSLDRFWSKPLFPVYSNCNTILQTDFLSYYGGDILRFGSKSKLILESLSGNAAVGFYLSEDTKIGRTTYNAGYQLLPSGIDLLSSETNNVTITAPPRDLDLEVSSVTFSNPNGLVLKGTHEISIEGSQDTLPLVVTFDTPSITMRGSGSNSFEFESEDDKPVFLFFAQDTVVNLRGNQSYTIKAGFYEMPSEFDLYDVIRSNAKNPIYSKDDILQEERIPPLFPAPGLQDGTGTVTIPPSFEIDRAPMGGVYH